MKKKILGLALALVMLISLLPLTAMAAENPMPKYIVNDGNLSSRLERGIIPGEVTYIVFEDVEGGNKPVKATEEVPTDNYIKMEFVEGVCYITFKNVSYKRNASGGSSDFLQIYNNSNYTNEFDIVLTLEGQNVIEGSNTKMAFTNTGDMTVTGAGSLTFNVNHTSNVLFQKKGDGDLIIKDTTVVVNSSSTTTATTTSFCVAGNMIIDNSTVNVTGTKNYGITIGTKHVTKLEDATKGVTIKNGSNVSLVSSSSAAINSNGPTKIENSNVELLKGMGNKNSVATSMPYATGATVELKKNAGKTPEYKDFAEFEIAEGTVLTTDDAIIGYKATHTCSAQADDGDCSTAVTCACGKEYAAAKEHAGVVTDCTKDTKCTNAGCTKIFKAAADAHVAGEDDGDCTTAIKCANCDQIAVEAKAHVGGTATCTTLAKCEACGKEYGELAAHTVSRPDCSVDGVCSVCNQVIYQAGQHSGGSATCKELAKCESCGAEYGELAAHTGGTATCKDKAKCSVCGAEYGELTACAPAADDGDCTTAIKCSVCGKETTAAKEHKYTNNADTACDNEGCTHTRKVEAPSTKPENNGNPQDGDNTALVLFATLMVASAAAFVCTKKFAVR